MLRVVGASSRPGHRFSSGGDDTTAGRVSAPFHRSGAEGTAPETLRRTDRTVGDVLQQADRTLCRLTEGVTVGTPLAGNLSGSLDRGGALRFSRKRVGVAVILALYQRMSVSATRNSARRRSRHSIASSRRAWCRSPETHAGAISGGIIAEHNQVQAPAGLFDVSHMGRQFSSALTTDDREGAGGADARRFSWSRPRPRARPAPHRRRRHHRRHDGHPACRPGWRRHADACRQRRAEGDRLCRSSLSAPRLRR